ncbi:Transcriptional regulator [Enhygromyxa salina]|uniref:Transcriptional regulator n=1 Tax=Enhygromyxa salina TaxID=215803 RepID=A0A0C2A0G4_9BACT|nr:sigma-54 dependent transcriptional regulator [Enhygromyxa salina]KIG16863.1 Transcriptional regulator [Enhygromyxa salina]
MLFRLLVATDRRPLAKRLSALVGMQDVLVRAVELDKGIVEFVRKNRYDAVVLGCRSFSGVAALVGALRGSSTPPEVVIVTESHDVQSSAAILAAGGLGVLTTDFGDDELRTAFETLIERARTLREAASELAQSNRLGTESADDLADDLVADLVAASPAMRRAIEVAKRAAIAESTVLLLGETGVGKERIAQLVHAQSPRASAPFIAINCAAIPAELVESELFGHERGAFTGAHQARRGHFERAHGGTLFLDEVAELPVAAQAKLLRVIEDRQLRPLGSDKLIPIDVRLIAATNRDLEVEIDAGRFRSDLYYRLGVIELELPPLRERIEDLSCLLDRELARFNLALGRKLRGFTPPARRALEGYAWPGNIRELINVIERAVLLCLGDEISLEDLPRSVARSQDPKPGPAHPPLLPSTPPDQQQLGQLAQLELPEAWLELPWREVRDALLRDGERIYLTHLLTRTRGRIGLTAQHAGLAERSLFEKMRRHGLRKEDFRSGTEDHGDAPADPTED